LVGKGQHVTVQKGKAVGEIGGMVVQAEKGLPIKLEKQIKNLRDPRRVLVLASSKGEWTRSFAHPENRRGRERVGGKARGAVQKISRHSTDASQENPQTPAQ